MLVLHQIQSTYISLQDVYLTTLMGRYQDSSWPPVLLWFQLQWSRWSALFGGMDPPHWIAQCPEYLLLGNPKSTALVMVVSNPHTYHMH